MNLTGKSQIDQARIEWGIRLRFSPMPRLDMEWIVTQLNSFRIGAIWECGRTWEIMQERDNDLSGSMNKRCEDVAGLDWEVFCEDTPEGHAHKDALEYAYDNVRVTGALDQDKVGDVSQLIFNICRAHANYYSVHEMLLRIDSADKKQATFELRECPIWFFEARRGYLGYLANLFDVYGQPLKSGEWLPAVGYGYMRACSVLYAIKHFSLRDWLLFSQRSGIPWVQGKTDAPIDSPEWNQALQVLASLGNDGMVLTNNSFTIEPIEANAKPHEPFEPLVEYCNRGYDKLFRGSDLASGSRQANKGSGGGGGGKVVGASVQSGEKDILQKRDAKWITPILQDRFDRPLIAYLFGTEPKAWIRILGPADQDTESDLAVAEFAVTNGVPYAVDDFRNKFGVPEPKPGAAILTAPIAPPQVPGAPGEKPGDTAAPGVAGTLAPGAKAGGVQTADLTPPGASRPGRGYNYAGGQETLANTTAPAAPGPSDKFNAAAAKAVADALAPDVSLINERFAALMRITDPQLFLQRATALQQWLTANEVHFWSNPHLLDAIHNLQFTAFGNGLAEKTKAA